MSANAAGVLAVVLLIDGSGLLQTGHGQTVAAIAETKMNLSFPQAFIRGILCNALVCIAVWMILAGRTIPSKLAGLVLPISAFITLGFEHSIANSISCRSACCRRGLAQAAFTNLLAVTLGNLVGGIAVALAFWRRLSAAPPGRSDLTAPRAAKAPFRSPTARRVSRALRSTK